MTRILLVLACLFLGFGALLIVAGLVSWTFGGPNQSFEMGIFWFGIGIPAVLIGAVIMRFSRARP